MRNHSQVSFVPMLKPVPDPRIAGYVAEVSVPGIPWISTSHLTLRGLNSQHGADVVKKLLTAHWLAVREYDDQQRVL